MQVRNGLGAAPLAIAHLEAPRAELARWRLESELVTSGSWPRLQVKVPGTFGDAVVWSCKEHRPGTAREKRQMTGSSGSRTPNVARIHNYLLGGKDNFAEDRQAAARLAAAIPDVVAGARANRDFLGRTVRFLAVEAGIRQFLDIGAGLPTMGNSHEVARAVAHDARVAYLDIDPVVISHAQGLLGKNPGVRAILGDLRDPAGILSHPDLRAHIDLREPAAVLLVAVLHFIPGEQPYRAVSSLMAAMAPGSYLVISHGTGDNLGGDAIERMREVYAGATAPAAPRAAADVTGSSTAWTWSRRASVMSRPGARTRPGSRPGSSSWPVPGGSRDLNPACSAPSGRHRPR